MKRRKEEEKEWKVEDDDDVTESENDRWKLFFLFFSLSPPSFLATSRNLFLIS